MTGTSDKNDTLEEYFRAMRARNESPNDDLLARVLADAEAEQTRHASSVPVMDADAAVQIRARQTPGFWGRLTGGATRSGFDFSPLRLLGGWPVATGFAAVTCAGIWIGTLPQNPISETGLFVVSDAGTELAAWGDVMAFGLTSETVSADGTTDAVPAEDL